MIDYQALTNSTDAPRSYLSAADPSDTEQPRQRDGSRAAVEVRQLEEEFCLSVASLNECFLFTSGSPSLAPGGAGLSGETCACVCVCVCVRVRAVVCVGRWHADSTGIWMKRSVRWCIQMNTTNKLIIIKMNPFDLIHDQVQFLCHIKIRVIDMKLQKQTVCLL